MLISKRSLSFVLSYKMLKILQYRIKKVILEYTLKNITISYDKIKYSIFEMLDKPERFIQNLPPIYR